MQTMMPTTQQIASHRSFGGVNFGSLMLLPVSHAALLGEVVDRAVSFE